MIGLFRFSVILIGFDLCLFRFAFILIGFTDHSNQFYSASPIIRDFISFFFRCAPVKEGSFPLQIGLFRFNVVLIGFDSCLFRYAVILIGFTDHLIGFKPILFGFTHY
ncbi:hypothetical protein [Paenisporosarcina sp. TG-14]|uniref:hypothetical protein n=1 Tax=Paenisporosarcina sp. TG-14 TaxID=1231057 RepID=UPI001ED9B46B|nr:hypothetical protein [Paenisporosarcina sp. TG-14]